MSTLATRVGGKNRVIGGPFGSKLTQADYVTGGVPVIRGANMERAGRWLGGEYVFVSEIKARTDLASNLASPGDIIVTQRGTLGQVSIVRQGEGHGRYVISQSQMAISVDPNIADPLFVYYFLRSPQFAKHLDSTTIQTGVPHINLGILRDTPVDWPSLDEQHAIASVLGALDDKIELNRRMNETLEAVARAIFKDWFNQNCQQISRVRAQKLVDQGLLAIGDGYRAKNAELYQPGLPFLRAANLNNGFDLAGADVLSQESVNKAREKKSRPGDVAFTSKGTIGRFARVGDHTGEFVYSPQVCFWRSLRPDVLPPAVLYCWMQSSDFQEQVHAVSGQTDMAPYVSLQDQRRMLVPEFTEAESPPVASLDPLLQRHSLNIAENQTLAALRNLLLPKLMSGEIRVNDAEKIVGGTV